MISFLVDLFIAAVYAGTLFPIAWSLALPPVFCRRCSRPLEGKRSCDWCGR